MNRKVSRLKKAAWFSAAFLLVVILLLWFARSTTFAYEYGIKAQQYVTMNIPKNWGVRKSFLKFADSILQWRPVPDRVEFDRARSPAGASVDYKRSSLFLPSTDNVLHVTDSQELVQALRDAKAGQLILLAPGHYLVEQRTIRIGHSGEPGFPVTLAAEQPGQAEIRLNSLEGLYINKPYWVIKNLTFRGVCRRHSACEHALHLTGKADHIVIENNRFIDFNAHLKSNGRTSGGTLHFPDNVTVRHNDFYNNSIRESRNPASPIDVVGGNNWLIEGNYIADFSRTVRGKPSVVYGAYLKGGGKDGVIRNNVINCAWKLPHQSVLDLRVALSLGNGGTGKRFCQSKDCAYEHKGGIIEQNLLLNCSNDVAIYLNKATQTRIHNNVLLNTLGLDARFAATDVVLENNLIQGRIKARDDARVESYGDETLPPGRVYSDLHQLPL
ncbi:chondroitinase-B domain-containing protein [Lacimicrobium alkaliphilum]|uniref:Right handed beta helix domain-containing protein n=1 Tax=Lacimicrobium alkaliphilum TaxID=1526571 RepID=A0ABQ1RMU3_9ALTE|nr:right-handed parallel beta-helix repeat-containing protein [Lacimicrobium alkaliphilum]GGD75221.1 hypothetical protein GCM10011357_32780 [Lacimicrobium alkaliphilum]